jgi:hypothetical protein
MKSMRFSISLLLLAALCRVVGLSVQAQPVQPKMVGAGINSNHLFGFGLYAPLGRTYEIDSSPDFSSWTPVTSGIVADSVPFVDANPPRQARLVYRAGIDWTIQVPNTYLIFHTNSGVDGRVIAYPFSGWNTAQGADGRVVAYPSGWATNQGPDGRLIAYPTNWVTTNSPDGRLVAFPPMGCTLVTNANGRVTVHPASGVPGAGTNSYQLVDWNLATGGDGRQAAYPFASFSTNEGSDGRMVAYPAAGWTTNRGPDGRMVAYPVTGFTTNSAVGGRLIAFPSSGWTTAGGVDGRLIVYPALNTSTLVLDFEDQQFFAFIGHLRTVLGDPDFENYIIYRFFGTGEQRFPD